MKVKITKWESDYEKGAKRAHIVASEWYHPEYANDNYCGEEIPYEYTEGGNEKTH